VTDKKRIEDSKFEDFLLQRNEKIDSLAYDLLCELAGKKIEWNMGQVAEVWEAAHRVLEEAGIPYCHPYWWSNDVSEEIPCITDPTCKCEKCVE